MVLGQCCGDGLECHAAAAEQQLHTHNFCVTEPLGFQHHGTSLANIHTSIQCHGIGVVHPQHQHVD